MVNEYYSGQVCGFFRSTGFASRAFQGASIACAERRAAASGRGQYNEVQSPKCISSGYLVVIPASPTL